MLEASILKDREVASHLGTAERFVKDSPPMSPKIPNDVHEIVSPSAVMVRSAIHRCQGETPPRSASRRVEKGHSVSAGVSHSRCTTRLLMVPFKTSSSRLADYSLVESRARKNRFGQLPLGARCFLGARFDAWRMTPRLAIPLTTP
jgi:hypothetical protein